MTDKQKEIFKLLVFNVLWWIEEEQDIFTEPMRNHLSDETIEELIDEVNGIYKINIKYTPAVDEMDIFQFCKYVEMQF